MHAQTPEEFETSLEDSFITGDWEMLAELLEEDALVVVNGSAKAPPLEAIREFTFVGDPRIVLQKGNLALTVGNGVNLLRRGEDRSWRLAISMFETNETKEIRK